MKRSQEKAIHAKRGSAKRGSGISSEQLQPIEREATFYMTFNKDSIGGLLVEARNEQEAKKIAEDQWGVGAKTEFYGKSVVTTIPNTGNKGDSK